MARRWFLNADTEIVGLTDNDLFPVPTDQTAVLDSVIRAADPPGADWPYPKRRHLGRHGIHGPEWAWCVGSVRSLTRSWGASRSRPRLFTNGCMGHRLAFTRYAMRSHRSTCSGQSSSSQWLTGPTTLSPTWTA